MNDVPPAPSATPTPVSLDEMTDRVAALQRLQAPAIAAQMEFQRLMAESHVAFLRALETSYASVAGAVATSPAVGAFTTAPALAPAPAALAALTTAPRACACAPPRSPRSRRLP